MGTRPFCQRVSRVTNVHSKTSIGPLPQRCIGTWAFCSAAKMMWKMLCSRFSLRPFASWLSFEGSRGFQPGCTELR